MRFFTSQQKAALVISGAFTAPITSFLSASIGMFIGSTVGYNNAVKYANESGCEVVWDAWQNLPSEDALEACGQACVIVCKAAMDIHQSAIWTYGTILTATGTGVAVLGCIGLAYYYYFINQKNPGFLLGEDEESFDQKNPELQGLADQTLIQKYSTI